METPPPSLTNDQLATFFGVGDDTRRDLLRALGLPKRQKHARSEVWVALGLEPEQPQELWEELMLRPDGRTSLWDADRVALEIGKAPSTVNGWCASGVFPQGFPPPLVDFRRKTRLWLRLEVRAYIEPSIYGDLARQIRRRPRAATTSAPAASVTWSGTLEPLPEVDAAAPQPKATVRKKTRGI